MSYKSASRNDKNPENVKRKTNILSLITVLLCFAVILSIALAMLVFYRPEFDNNIPFDTDPASSLDSNEDNDKQKSEIANFLILGCDRSGGLNTDVIIIASFNIGKGTVNMVQIPRDTYVNAGTSSRKINSLYASFYVRAKNAKVKDAHAKAVYDLIAVIEPNLCVKIHHYITMDLKGFANIVDAIGGVDIVLPDDLYYHDSTPGHELIIDLKAGPQTLDGKAAEQFVRFRMGYKMADIARMDAQKLFIAAFIKKLKNNVNITTIFPLAEQVIKNVRTDMSVADCVYYA
ncbi:MAG: hypothetical protein GX303_09050, partial [Clostridiales bacterium]|nr:hypothetical protein [Clostridiales bacterium]